MNEEAIKESFKKCIEDYSAEDAANHIYKFYIESLEYQQIELSKK